MLTPNWKKVTAASLVVALLTVLTSLFAPPYVPSEAALSGAVYGPTDVEQFFRPHNITPAVWGVTPSLLNCIQDWIERENVRPHSDKFVDWEYTFLESGCPVYPVPEGGLIFHVYWSGNWRPFNEVTIEAFLATQRLRDGHKLIYWYENGEPSQETRQRWTAGEYAKYVEFRQFNRTEEADGTCLASMPEYVDVEYQQSLNMGQATLSDLVRVLLLAKYGGIWLDADVIPMRDLTPMIRAGPTAPWLHDNDSNNALLNFGPAEAGVGAAVLAVTCTMSYNETLFHERYPSIQPSLWNWLYNDGLLKICQTMADCGVNRLTAWFTDGEWFNAPEQEDLRACDDRSQDKSGFRGKALPAAVHSLWTWHMRLDNKKDKCLAEDADTLAMAFRRRVR